MYDPSDAGQSLVGGRCQPTQRRDLRPEANVLLVFGGPGDAVGVTVIHTHFSRFSPPVLRNNPNGIRFAGPDLADCWMCVS